MSYAEVLQRYIRESGKTLDEIADGCKSFGISIHPTYVSKLRLGQRPAPSEEISRALAAVTGGNAEELILAGYMEKAPAEVQRLLNKVDSVDTLLRDVFDFLFQFVDRNKIIEMAKEEYNVTDENLIEVFKHAEFGDYFDKMNIEEKLNVLDIMILEAKEKNMHVEELLSKYNIFEKDSNYTNNNYENQKNSEFQSFFQELASAPEHKIRKLMKMWEIIGADE